MPERWLANALPFALVLARVLPLGWTLATLTGELVPRAIALSLSLAVACALLPVAGPAAPVGGPAELLLALLRELCIGGTFALALSLALLAISWVVRLSQPPGSQRPVEAFARLYALCATYLVLALGGLRAIVQGLAESFRDASLGGARLDARTFALGSAQLVVDAFATALAFALPLLLASFLLEACVALVARVLAPALAAQTPLLRPLLFFLSAALLLVPTASHAPEAVRAAIESARALTRALAR